MTSLGERIRARRTELGLRQVTLARKVGISSATLSVLESNPTAQTRAIAKFASVLGVNALWLAEGRGNKVPDGCDPMPKPQQEIPPKVLRLAEQLAKMPDKKLEALAVLIGLKL